MWFSHNYWKNIESKEEKPNAVFESSFKTLLIMEKEIVY